MLCYTFAGARCRFVLIFYSAISYSKFIGERCLFNATMFWCCHRHAFYCSLFLTHHMWLLFCNEHSPKRMQFNIGVGLDVRKFILHFHSIIRSLDWPLPRDSMSTMMMQILPITSDLTVVMEMQRFVRVSISCCVFKRDFARCMRVIVYSAGVSGNCCK